MPIQRTETYAAAQARENRERNEREKADKRQARAKKGFDPFCQDIMNKMMRHEEGVDADLKLLMKEWNTFSDNQQDRVRALVDLRLDWCIKWHNKMNSTKHLFLANTKEMTLMRVDSVLQLELQAAPR